MKKYIAIDVGGTTIKYGLISKEAIIIEQNEIKTEATLGGKAILEKVIAIIEDYVSNEDIAGVAISTAGTVDPSSGEITYASPLIPSYKGINYKYEVEKRFGLKCEVENDVNCAGLAESISGASKEMQSSVMLTIGTGIGGAFVLNGEVYHGFSNNACKVGNMQIDGEPYEAKGATSILVNKVAERKGEDVALWDGRRIFELAKEGDAICVEEICCLVDEIAKGIANICYVLNPEMVVLGGGIMSQKDYLKDLFAISISKYLIDGVKKHTKIEFAEHGNRAGMLGAYYNFVRKHGEV